MTVLADQIRHQAREVAALLRLPQSPETDDKLEEVGGELLVALADGFALLVEKASTLPSSMRNIP